MWPDDSQLRAATFAYIDASRHVAEQVLALYGKALGLPQDTFPRSELPYLTLTARGQLRGALNPQARSWKAP